MSKGGLRKNRKGNYDHLFNGKWSLGKTTTIRIPIILKDKFLSLAKYLDKKPKEEIKNINLVNEISSNNQLDETQKYKIAIECFEEFLDSQNFSLVQLRQSRSGTKKRQLADIHDWLSGCESNANQTLIKR